MVRFGRRNKRVTEQNRIKALDHRKESLEEIRRFPATTRDVGQSATQTVCATEKKYIGPKGNNKKSSKKTLKEKIIIYENKINIRQKINMFPYLYKEHSCINPDRACGLEPCLQIH